MRDVIYGRTLCLPSLECLFLMLTRANWRAVITRIPLCCSDKLIIHVFCCGKPAISDESQNFYCLFSGNNNKKNSYYVLKSLFNGHQFRCSQMKRNHIQIKVFCYFNLLFRNILVSTQSFPWNNNTCYLT